MLKYLKSNCNDLDMGFSFINYIDMTVQNDYFNNNQFINIDSVDGIKVVIKTVVKKYKQNAGEFLINKIILNLHLVIIFKFCITHL